MWVRETAARLANRRRPRRENRERSEKRATGVFVDDGYGKADYGGEEEPERNQESKKNTQRNRGQRGEQNRHQTNQSEQSPQVIIHHHRQDDTPKERSTGDDRIRSRGEHVQNEEIENHRPRSSDRRRPSTRSELRDHAFFAFASSQLQ